MRVVDHQPYWHTRFGAQAGKDPNKHADAAPPGEPVVEGLVRPLSGRCILPVQAVADHVDDPAGDPTIMHPGKPAGTGTMRRETLHLRDGKKNQAEHHTPPLPYASYHIEPREGSCPKGR